MNDEWQTPDELYEKLDKEFMFDMDLCAQEHNTKCKDWTMDVTMFVDVYAKHMKHGAYWMNPPYSRGNIDECMKAAYDLSLKTTSPIVCLVRDDASTNWYQQYVDEKADSIRRLKHRVKFKGASSAYNFPCCLVIYNYTDDLPLDYTKTWQHLWSWKDE